jgi:hypothetical protein
VEYYCAVVEGETIRENTFKEESSGQSSAVPPQLSKLLEEFKRAGADLVTLHCPTEAAEAKKLYDKLGFEVRAYYMRKNSDRK